MAAARRPVRRSRSSPPRSAPTSRRSATGARSSSEVGRLPDVHVAASLFHDVAPANELGLPSIWINRLGETPGPQPTRELPDLSGARRHARGARVTVELRAATPDDAPAIKGLFDEHALAAFGEVALSEEEIRSWFAMPNIWIQLAERDGELVGYLDITSEESGHRRSTRGRSSPRSRTSCSRRRRGAGARSRRRRSCAGRPGREPVLREAFERAGWTPIRHSFQMRIELDGELPEPSWPDGLDAAERRARRGGARLRGAHGRLRRPLGLPPQPFEQWRASFDRHAPLRPVALVAGRGRGRAGGDLAQLVALLRRPAVRLGPGARRPPAVAQARARDARCCGTRSATSAARRDEGRPRRGRREHDRRRPASTSASACARCAATTPTRRTL